MRTIIYLILMTSFLFAQNHPRMKERNKLEELEKIKLIEELNLDEESSARFVSRLNENRRLMHEIQEKKMKIIFELEKVFIDNEEKDPKYFSERNNQIIELDNEFRSTREKFVKSLNDILTPEQVAKVLVFEVKFREEIKSAILKKGKRN